MNTTAILQQKQKIRATASASRVPYLLSYSEKYHNLLIKIGSASFVDQFRAKEDSEGLLLHVYLRNGEIPNLVVNQRLKNVSFPDSFEQQPIIIKIRS